MEPAVKDLLQLGFSFFVAGYLLVWGQRTTHEVSKLVSVQGDQLRVMQAVLVRMEGLLMELVRR